MNKRLMIVYAWTRSYEQQNPACLFLVNIELHKLNAHQLSIQPGAVKLVLWRRLMYLSYMHPVTSENQFHCTRLYQDGKIWGSKYHHQPTHKY